MDSAFTVSKPEVVSGFRLAAVTLAALSAIATLLIDPWLPYHLVLTPHDSLQSYPLLAFSEASLDLLPSLGPHSRCRVAERLRF